MNSNIRIINQMVDTLKLHYYPSQDLTDKELGNYNLFISDLKDLKQQAMNIVSDIQQDRKVKTNIDNIGFDVMARAVKSFSVLLQNNDITIALKNVTEKSNNPVIKIEFRSEYLTRNGYVRCINRVNKIIESFLPKYKIKVSEIHLATDIQGYNFTPMDRQRFKFRNRTLQEFNEVDNTAFSSGTKQTGFSFGKDSFMLRVYDKTHQIHYKKDAGYVKVLRWETNSLYNEDQKVWRIEFQFRRDYLKTLVTDTGVLDGFENVLNAIPEIWKHAIDRFVHHGLTDDQCVDVYRGYTLDKNGIKKELTKDAHRKRLQRAGASNLWKGISLFNNTASNHEITHFKESKKPEVEYVVNCFKGLVSTYVKLNRGNFNSLDLSEILVTANEQELNKKGFSILDNAKLKSVDYVQNMRTQYEQNGIITDGFDQYNYDLKKNLLETLRSIDDKEYQAKFFDECIKRGTLIYGNYHKGFENAS